MIFDTRTVDVSYLTHLMHDSKVQCEWWSGITVDTLVGYDG